MLPCSLVCTFCFPVFPSSELKQHLNWRSLIGEWLFLCSSLITIHYWKIFSCDLHCIDCMLIPWSYPLMSVILRRKKPPKYRKMNGKKTSMGLLISAIQILKSDLYPYLYPLAAKSRIPEPKTFIKATPPRAAVYTLGSWNFVCM